MKQTKQTQHCNILVTLSMIKQLTEKEMEGKNLTVKVCMDSDVKIIGKAFVSSDTIGVDSQCNIYSDTVKPTKKMIPKKQRRKSGKVVESNDQLLIKVHQVMQVAMPHDTNNSKKSVSTAMSNKIFKWSQGLFCKHFWTTQHIHQFEILSNFLYNTVQEDDIDYPSHLTWIDNVVCGEDDDLYAIWLLFVLTCLKHVRNAMLQLLEDFVNSPMFNVDYVLQLGEDNLKKEIQHLGMGNKNTSDIILMFKQIKKYIEECGHFLHMLLELT